MPRIGWDDYYLFRAFWTARRSPDPTTKHGCALVGKDHRPISEGYNGYPRGSKDDEMPTTRPLKYGVVIHAEENSLYHAERSLLEGSVAYVTGMPCSNCWARLIHNGISEVVIGPKKSQMVDEISKQATEAILNGRDNLWIREWTPNHSVIIENVLDVLSEIGIDMAEVMESINARIKAK